MRSQHILNISTGVRIDCKLANTALDACSVIWVERNVSIRNATPDEAIVLRNQQAARSVRLAAAELRNTRYVPTPTNAEGDRRQNKLARITLTFVDVLCTVEQAERDGK